MSQPIYVPATGSRNAKIVIVGEAPGQNEERSRTPFTGYSGQILHNTLSRVGISEADVYITNLCHYRPPGNNISRWFDKRGKSYIPKQQICEGLTELYRDLAEIKPNVVVPLGNTALWALCGVGAIAKRRGSILSVNWDMKRTAELDAAGALTSDLLDDVAKVMGMKVIPTYHPAYVLRQMEHLVIFQTDMARIKEDSTFKALRLPDRTYFINPPDPERDELVARLLKGTELSFDIECVGYRLYCVGFANDPTWALTLTSDTPGNVAAIRDLLASDTMKIAQNGLFDTTFLRAHADIDVNRFEYDTMVAQHAAYPSLPKGLDFLCSVHTREPYYKDEGKNWDPRDAADVERFLTYNAKDVCSTLEIAHEQMQNEMQDPGYRATFDRVMSQMPVYAEQTVKGIRIDLKKMLSWREQFENDWHDLQKALDAAAMGLLAQRAKKLSPVKAKPIVDFIQSRVPQLGTQKGAINVNSTKILSTFLYDHLGLKVKTNRKTGGRTTNEDALKELYGETQNKLLLTVVSIREKRKRISSYLSVKTDANGVAHFSVNPVKTKTGRSSYGKTIVGEGNNKQTIPHELRAMYVPDVDGYKFAYLDLDQAEARIVAYRGGISRMIQAFEAKQVKYTESDVHSLTAHALLDIPYSEIKEYPHRYLGKRCNHAFNYEMGPEKFYKIIAQDSAETGVSLTRKEAKLLREKHLRTYPELRTYWGLIRDQLSKNRTIVNPMGRKRVFLGRLDADTFREAYSHYAQSTVADVLRTGMVAVHNGPVQHLRNAGYPHTRVVLEIHDALLLQYPEEHEDDFLSACVSAMTIPFKIGNRDITIPVGIECGYNWGHKDDDNPTGLDKYVLKRAS